MKKLSLMATGIALTVVMINGVNIPDSELNDLLRDNVTYLSMYLCQEFCVDCGYDESEFDDDDEDDKSKKYDRKDEANDAPSAAQDV